MTEDMVRRDDEYWAEVEQAVGKGTCSTLFGTSTRSLRRSLARLKEDYMDLPPGPVDFDKLTRQKQLADAILLERAVNVLLRRGFLHLPLLQQLGQFAADLRKGAEGE